MCEDIELARARRLREEEEKKSFEAALTLAGIRPTKAYRLENGYWPRTPAYFSVSTPWYLYISSELPPSSWVGASG